MIIRRDERSRAERDDPDQGQPEQDDRELHRSARRPGTASSRSRSTASAASQVTSWSSVKPSRKRDRERQDDVGDRRRRSRRSSRASGIHGRSVLRSLGGQAGRDERPELVQQDRHRQDDPDHERDLELDEERVARARGPGAAGVAGSGASRTFRIGSARAGTRSTALPTSTARIDLKSRLRSSREVVDERHHLAAVGRRRRRRRGGRDRRRAGGLAHAGPARTASASAISGRPTTGLGRRTGARPARSPSARRSDVGHPRSARRDGRRCGLGGEQPGLADGTAAARAPRRPERGRRRAARPARPAARPGSGEAPRRASTWAASVMSEEALRNSRMLLPSAAPTSGSLPGPMTIKAMIRMMISSSGPDVRHRRWLRPRCWSRGRRRAGLDALARVARAGGQPSRAQLPRGLAAIAGSRAASRRPARRAPRRGPGDPPRDVDEEAAAGPPAGRRRRRPAVGEDGRDVAALGADARHEERQARRDRPDLGQLGRAPSRRRRARPSRRVPTSATRRATRA